MIYATLNGNPLSSILSNGASFNPMLHGNESFWIQWNCMDSQWINHYVEKNSAEFNDKLNRIPIINFTMFLNGLSFLNW